MQIAYIPEVTPGTTPATPVGITIRAVSFDGNINVPTIESKEIRTDRMRAPGSLGTIEAAPQFGGEVSYGTLDDLLSALFGAAWATNVLKVGTSYTPSTLTLEHKDEGTASTKYQSYLGMVVDKLSLSGGLGQNVEYQVNGMAMSVPTSTVATLFSSITPANANPVFGPASGQGSISIGGVSLTGCTKWSFSFENGASINRACYQAGAHSVRQKAIKVTAQLDVYHEDQTNYDRWKVGTEVAMALTLGNGSTKSYTLDFARARVLDVKCPEAEGVRTESLTLEIYVPVSGTDTACKITRKP